MAGTVEHYERWANSAAEAGILHLDEVKEMLMSVPRFSGSVKIAMLRAAIVKLEETCKRIEYGAGCLERAIEIEARKEAKP